ncbi:patatin-like phospholipase family protein [Acidisoma silvae]|uniref:Patatin-like phospholipase family protein n=1 Tax=Acidisoma silvae TaxID=2802396 RepID=A0A963YNV4_9PROT|nr:patatin-like phospholipase family protein [Acidisoma silvae]MCB8874002.1 patatin-like phospholipase family protein [Acidisoma silvae]
MTAFPASDLSGQRPDGQGCVLALQGGAAHGAFTWGAVDRLLEAGKHFDKICGVSAGAMLGAVLVQGMVENGATGARAAMRRLWDGVSAIGAIGPLQRSPLERFLYGSDLSSNVMWAGLETAMRLFSPHQLNPLGHNPLRPLMQDLLRPDLLAAPGAPDLFVGVTDVETGAPVIFRNGAITVEVLLASACLPLVFPAVEIDGRAYWDGGYSGNPPLEPLLTPMPHTLILVRGQPARRPGVPRTPAEVMNRLNEIACHAVLETELAALPANVTVISVDADAALGTLPISSKFNTDRSFLAELFAEGQHAADRALALAAPLTEPLSA